MLLCTSQFCGNLPSLLATTHYYKNHTSNERQYSNSIIQNDNNLPLQTHGQETAYADNTLCLIVYTCKYIYIYRFTH